MGASNPERTLDQRLVVVANRLPVSLKQGDGGTWKAHPSSGGLVTAMEPVLREHGGIWIGWPGTAASERALGDVLREATADAGYEVVPVFLTQEEQDQFYFGYSNEVIWPLFHDWLSHCNFDPSYWGAYKTVNERFAAAIIENARPNDFIWVHDYQLMDVAFILRQQEFNARLAFFLHIPFPPLDIFIKLPQQPRLLRALLQFDLLGFQTDRDRFNFVECCRRLLKEATVHSESGFHRINFEGRDIRVGRFPIGIDFEAFKRNASSAAVAKQVQVIQEGLPDQQIILGVDRLDYTKGIPDRLKAYGVALERHPELIQKITFIQVVVPSRVNIPMYIALRVEIEQLVGKINGQFSVGHWTPIHYYFRSLGQDELLAYYRAAEIALITPHKDGMNLVAKEYCACSIEEDCVLILSEFAGAAAQLKRGALMINPYDVEQTAEAIYQAFSMTTEERRERMQKLRRSVRKEDIFWWVNSFCAAAR